MKRKRIFDILAAVFLLCILGVPMLIIALLIKLNSKGPVLYWSNRVGTNNVIFRMPKFRTMKQGTPTVATHLLINPEQYLISVGRMLRKFSLDELPQLYSVIRGDLSFVGPRPALYNQDDLILLRTQKGIDKLIPGITGWAQINGRDGIPIPIKVDYDTYYLKNRSFRFDLKILLKTCIKTISAEGVNH
jgi:O-antigen biosynthesis protein WbqP